MEIILRSYNSKTDDGYIYSTWLKFAWYSPGKPHDLKKAAFFTKTSKEIKDLLCNPEVDTKVACLKEDPDIIIGYAVGTSDQLFWLCVKKQFRNQGIEEFLIQSIRGKNYAKRKTEENEQRNLPGDV